MRILVINDISKKGYEKVAKCDITGFLSEVATGILLL